jgi:hypothetical protein
MRHDNNEIKYPFSMGWLGNYSNMYSYKGRDYVEENPQFNFRKSELLSYWGDLIQGSKR